MPKAPRTSRYVVVDEGTRRKHLGLDGRRRRVHLEDMDFCRKWEAMSPNEKAKYNAEQRQFEPWLAGRAAQPVVVLEGDGDDATSANWVDVQEDDKRLQRILKGDERIEISHEGEEYGQMIGGLNYALLRERQARLKWLMRDKRIRCDRTKARNIVFEGQMESMVEAFAHWEATRGKSWLDCLDFETPSGEARESIPVRVVDMFCSYTGYVTTYSTDPYTATAFLSQYGQWSSFDELAFVHPASRCKHSPPLSPTFTKGRRLRQGVEARVKKALLRDSPNWRLMNACPSCLYKVDDEPPMKYAIHSAIDGNNSLVRVELKTKIKEAAATDMGAAEAASKETEDVGSSEGDGAAASKAVEKTKTAEPMVSSGEPEDSGCEDRWHNMVNDMSSKMWGIYEETGIFLGVCRHGMVLLATNMIRSGELSKYPLAVIERLLDVLQDNLCMGYDCGCKFKKTVARSSLGPSAGVHRLKFVVGLFHGHAHARSCQLFHLGTYIEGMGLEDHETCERFFAKSNVLAPIVRHSSAFHRHQAIRTYFEHMDEIESFQALTVFLHDNFRQAFEIRETRGTLLKTMSDLGWLNEERAYLTSLKKEPAVETLQMEYYRALLALDDLTSQQTEALKSMYSPNDPQGNRKKERQRRAILKKHELKLEEVVALEDRLYIVERWEMGSLARQELAERVATRDYCLALDKLESLVVARIFELTKMNMSQTGYKLRKHIAKALQVRSKAVKTALKKFNNTAACMSPPRPQLAWEEVVAYGFLAKFNVLRDLRNDIRDKGWACEAGRRAMDSYFKILPANEELVRCTTEAIRLLTYMDDEESYLKAAYHGMKEDLPDIAFQIQRRYHLRVQLHADHCKRLRRIQKLDGWDKAEEEGLVKELKPGKRRGVRHGFEVSELPGQREADGGEMIMVGAPPEIMSVGNDNNDN
ncbi:hypothetical protein CPB85DRAFT_1252735 [Mucidula mucida]|nr:hypothetical protein CPB85DRAFT_1252735 [Mucidula mucida]